MITSRRLLLVAALVVAACAPVTSTSDVVTDGPDFIVEAHPDLFRGRPVVAGRVYNKRAMQATRVQLRIEAVNAAGAVVGSGVRFLDRDINPSDRVYFEVPPPVTGAAYRVTVDYVFWRPGGGGGGAM